MIQKIWNALTALDLEYAHLMNNVMNNFSQEIINWDGFEKNSYSTVSVQETIETIRATLDKNLVNLFENTALEFCVTNEYIIDGTSWNCINHMLKYHKALFGKNDIEYLKALNTSYVSIYKVSYIKNEEFIKLSNMIEKDQTIIINDKKTIKYLDGIEIAATRILQHQRKASITYHISDTLLPLSHKIARKAIDVINSIMNSYPFRKSVTSFTPNEILLSKKMWVKEILEQWYLHNSHHKNKGIVLH